MLDRALRRSVIRHSNLGMFWKARTERPSYMCQGNCLVRTARNKRPNWLCLCVLVDFRTMHGGRHRGRDERRYPLRGVRGLEVFSDEPAGRYLPSPNIRDLSYIHRREQDPLSGEI